MIQRLDRVEIGSGSWGSSSEGGSARTRRWRYGGGVGAVEKKEMRCIIGDMGRRRRQGMWRSISPEMQ